MGEPERLRIDEVSRKLGLWGLDAPEDVGGSDLPNVAMIAVNEHLGRTITPYTLPPDSPNLRMLRRRSQTASARPIWRPMFGARRSRPSASRSPAPAAIRPG